MPYDVRCRSLADDLVTVINEPNRSEGVHATSATADAEVTRHQVQVDAAPTAYLHLGRRSTFSTVAI